MANGWIVLHRQIQECSIWTDNEPFDRRSAWVDLILLVNHSDKEIIFNGQPMKIGRGQYLTSVRKLAERWNWSRDRVLRYLRLLESLQMIRKESDSTKTLITVEKYEIYQDVWDSNKDSYKDSIKDTVNDSDKAQTKKVKKVKNDKELKNIYGDYKHVKLTADEYEKLAVDYGKQSRDEAIKFFDEYLENNPKYKKPNHNLCIRNWVFNAVAEKKEKDAKYGRNNNTEVHSYGISI